MELQDPTLAKLMDIVSRSRTRPELWAEFVRNLQVRRMAEIGVYKGEFAASMLAHCPDLEKYYMVDPWRHLDDWNKPANESDAVFETFFETAKAMTAFAAERRVILRGKTTEVVDSIPDAELDFAYIDGDHTLKGIAIDLIRVFPKVRMGGHIGGDDFCRSIWQHKAGFEPTLVFPFAVYFAEAVGAAIYALPHSQFCLHKTAQAKFSFVDLTGAYSELGLKSQLVPAAILKRLAGKPLRTLARLMKPR